MLIFASAAFSQQKKVIPKSRPVADTVKTTRVSPKTVGQIKPPTEKYSETEKIMLYDVNKKDVTTAVLLSLTFTGGGHLYTGNWLKAGGFLLTKGAIIGATHYSFWNSENYTSFYIGYSFVILVYLWELIDAANEVTNYNRNLFSKLTGKNVRISLNQQSDVVSLQFSFAL